MATLVPKTSMQQSKPEVIFITDQSGSMQGARTKTLVAALRVFLKSLPVGIKFNICYFGTYDSFLFPKSQVYDQNSLETALKSLDGLDGECGGTETLSAVRASINSRDITQPLSVILATDGDIWQQQELFDYINDSVATSKKTLRIFALGIGNSVSSALIEGVARAGNGFSKSIGEGEKLDGKVIRMLKGALTPDHGLSTLEIQYQDDDDGDDFVMVERVSDSLRVLEFDEYDWPDAQLGKESAASAETTARGKKDVEIHDIDGQARHIHLPAVPAPKLIQTPQNIPPLYPSSCTNVYVLISPDAAQGTIKSVVMKGSSAEKPFELEIPVEVLSQRGETIHQLAAKKAVADLEEGRGWLVHAKDEKGVLIKEKHSARFQSMIEREAVRLGIQYQIAGKFTSFVATETDPDHPEDILSRKIGIAEEADASPPVVYSQSYNGPLFGAYGQSAQFYNGSLFGAYGQSAQSYNGSLSGARGSVLNLGAPAASGLFGSVTSRQQSAPSGMAPRMQLPSRKALKVSPFSAPIYYEVDTEGEETDPLHKIIALQTFEGYWNLNAPLLEIVSLSAQHKAPHGVDPKMWATVLAITFLEGKMASEKEVWNMVVDKARAWLEDTEEGGFEDKWTLAEHVIMGPG